MHSIPSRLKGEKGLTQIGRGFIRDTKLLFTKRGRKKLEQEALKKRREMFKHVDWKPRKQRGGQMGIVKRRRRRRKTSQLGGRISSTLIDLPASDMVRHLRRRYKSGRSTHNERKRF